MIEYILRLSYDHNGDGKLSIRYCSQGGLHTNEDDAWNSSWDKKGSARVQAKSLVKLIKTCKGSSLVKIDILTRSIVNELFWSKDASH